MSDDEQDEGLRGRITRSGEDVIGRLASELLENPLVTGAIGRIFEAREKASQAQAVAFGALNLPSAADLERLTRRVRSLSQRLESIEDGVDKLDRRLGAMSSPASERSVQDVETGLGKRIGAVEEALVALTREMHALREALPDAPRAVPASQERLQVDAPSPASKPRRRTKPASSS
jgi:chromosome segregation ATPase